MSVDAVLESLAELGEEDWIGLWLIADHAAEALGAESPRDALEPTLALVTELLRRGFRAGESPVLNAAHFIACQVSYCFIV